MDCIGRLQRLPGPPDGDGGSLLLQGAEELEHTRWDEEDHEACWNVPFGHQRLEDGTIQEIPEEMALARSIADMYRAGFPVMEISAKSQGKLTPRQVYGLMNYWGD